jgi:hypothetical protein
MAKKNDFEEEMRKADAAAYRASLSDEPGTESTRDFMKRTGTKARPPMARTYTKKGPIVTKEQMKKAGFDNLRDYLNAERGLTRRKTDTDIITEGATKLYEERKGPTTADLDRIATKQREEDKGPSEATVKRLSDEDSKRRSQAGEFGSFKKGGMVKKMKSGGTVSSASKRADGCAVRGKTKGRMI